MLDRLHHTQAAMPRGEESAARAFYAGVLGMTEIAKPSSLARAAVLGSAAGDVELHLGVEDDFRPAPPTRR